MKQGMEELKGIVAAESAPVEYPFVPQMEVGFDCRDVHQNIVIYLGNPFLAMVEAVKALNIAGPVIRFHGAAGNMAQGVGADGIETEYMRGQILH